MALNPPSGIVNWFNTPIGERGWNAFRAQLTGKDYPGTSRKTSYVKLSEEEANEVIENIKKDPEGIPIFDEANAPDKAEEYQKWLVARYFTKAREEGFGSRKQEGTKQLEEELGPEGLDELLNLIREESKVEVGASTGGGGDSPASSPSPPSPPPSSSALAVVPKKEDDLVEEEIDPQILSILGLEDVFDLTYEEYIRELKTASAAGRMTSSQMSTESIELVTEELKRVRGKTGKFKVKPKKLDINKVLDRKQPSPPGAIVKADKLIPQPEESLQETEEKSAVDVENFQDDLINGIGNILESLITIRSVLQGQSKTEQQEATEDRKETEKKKKKERESKLEKKKPQSPILKALTKPVDDFFESIKKFFTNVLLGSVVLGIFKWLKDPKNKQAIDDFTNFIENNLDKIFNGILALIGLRIGWKIFKWTRRLYKAFSWLKRKLPGGKPKPSSKPTIPKVGTNLGPTGSAKPGYTGPGRVRMPGQARAGGFFLEQARKAATGTSLPVAKGKDGGLLKNIKNLKNIKIGKGGWASISLGLLETGMGQDVLNTALEKIGLGIRSDSDEKIISEINRIDEELSSAWEKQKSRPEVYEQLNKFNINLFGKYYREAIRRKLIDEDGYILDKKNESNIKPQTPLMPGLPTSAAEPGTGPIGNQVGSGSATFGETGNVSNAAGWVHGHFQTNTGTDNDLVNDTAPIVKGLLDSGVVPELSKGQKFTPGMSMGEIKELIRVGITQHGHSGDGRSVDIFVPKGTKVPFPLADVRNTGGRGGITGILPGSGKVWVGHLSPTSKSGMVHVPVGETTQPAQVAQTAPPTPSIPSPTGRSNIIPLPIPTGGGAQQASSGTAPNQAPVPRFSSEDPNNTTTMVVRAIYNIVG